MQDTQQTPTASTGTSGFRPIPTRIRETPPLVVDQEASEIAQQVTERLAHLATRLATVHRAAAEAYLSQAMYEQALPHARAAATFAPGEAEYHNQLGFILYVQGDDAGAIQCFENVLAMNPDQADALFNMGMVRYGSQEYQIAEDCFRRALEVCPEDAETWNNRGVCLHQMGRQAEAKVCFERALQIDPSNEDARVNLTAITG
jgi:Flp pilus assembly protein TadD